jgi:putative FmdB family regulatory protein
MPTYQYECPACGYHFEELQSMTEDRLKKCPKCGKYNEVIPEAHHH